MAARPSRRRDAAGVETTGGPFLRSALPVAGFAVVEVWPLQNGGPSQPCESATVRRTVSSGGPFEDVYGYSRAVRVGGQVHVAGTTARAPDLEGADAYRQARAALAIIEEALRQVGSSTAAVVRTVTYVTDMADAELVARAHREVFGEVRPAATLVEVRRLIEPAMRVEIEVYAVEPD